MNNLNKLSEILISLNSVDDKKVIVGLTSTKQIVTKQQHNTINKKLGGLTGSISEEETFEDSVTRLKDRLIDLNINIEKNYLTSENIEKKIKQGISNLFPDEENAELSIEAVIQDTMPNILKNTNIKDQVKNLADEFEVAVMMGFKPEKLELEERNEKVRKDLLVDIRHNLTLISNAFEYHYGNFSLNIEAEILNYKDKNLEDLQKVVLYTRNRWKVAVQEMFDIRKKYDSLPFEKRKNITIFEYNKQISDIMVSNNYSFEKALERIDLKLRA